VPVLDAKGHMSPTEVERECGVDIAMRWGTGYDTKVSLLRQHHRHAQGRHPHGRFRAGPAQGVPPQLELNARRLKVGTDKVEKDDILAGLTAVVTVRLAEPQFEGQTKEVLGTAAVRAIVAKVVEQELTERLTSTKRGEKAAGGAAAGEGRLRDEVADQSRACTRRPSAQDRPGVLHPAGQARDCRSTT
jgi:DNA gyrase subunit B